MKIKPRHNACGVTLELGANEPAIPASRVNPEQAPPRLFNIRRILAPIDFSPCSKKAVQYAVPFARQFGAQLCLLYVGPSHYFLPELTSLELGTYKLSERADAAGRLASFAT